MKTELFGIKITKIEKGAINYIVKSSGIPASKIFYEDLVRIIRTKLGFTLLYDLSRAGEFDTTFSGLIKTNTPSIRRPPAILSKFLAIIDQSELKSEFRSMFNDIKFKDKSAIVHDFDITDLAYSLGTDYLTHQGTFSPVRLDIVSDIFFDLALFHYYQLTAVGSFIQLQQEWQKRASRVSVFKDRIKTLYGEEYEEAVEVTEEHVVEVLPEPSTRPVPSASSGGPPKKAPERKKRPKKRVVPSTGSGS